MIEALIIDDEKINIDILSEIISQYCPSVLIRGTFTNVDSAVKFINAENPQLIFLDIQMPSGSGFDLLDQIEHRNLEVIFVTAYDSYLLKAIRYSAIDYVLKPINVDEVVGAVMRAEERIEANSVNHQLKVLLNNITQPNMPKIALPYKDGYRFIDVGDIVHLEASKAYTNIFMKDGISYLTSRNIKEYEELLPPNIFCRIHHAHIVNVSFVKVYHKGRGGYVEMINGINIEVSARKKEEFLSRFKYLQR